jgi:nicotinamide riboside kinase
MAAEALNPKNIYIVGAQCTGKTIIVNALVTHFDEAATKPLLIEEVARGVIQKHQYTPADMTDSPVRALKLQHLILAAQVAAEEEAGSNWFISDRSAIDPIVYASLYASEEAAAGMFETEAWKNCRVGMQEGLVIVCEAGTPFLHDDGVRLMPEDFERWMAVHDMFCRLLQEQGITFTVIRKEMVDLMQRVQLILGLLDQ